MTDESISDLGHISTLRAISRTSIMTYKRAPQAPAPRRAPLAQISAQHVPPQRGYARAYAE